MAEKDFRVTKFFKGEVIFREGTPGNTAYILRDGRVEISIQSRGEKTVLALIEPVSVFGEMAILLEGHRRTATATAVEYAEVVAVERDAFLDALDRSPSIISSVMYALAERLRSTTAMVVRVPDLVTGICEILHLVSCHTGEIRYGITVNTIAKFFHVGEERVEEELRLLEDMRVLELKINRDGDKVIELLPKEFSLRRIVELYQAAGRKAPKKHSQRTDDGTA